MNPTPPPKQPTMTSANLPKPALQGEVSKGIANPAGNIQPQPEAQEPVFDGASIVARPLADPDFMALQPVNPMHQLYWSNRDYQNGFRVGYRSAQGFRLAKKADVKNLPEYMVDPSGQIVNGDLVLMIIGKNAYQGALLNNHNKAIRRGNKFGQVHQSWTEGPNGELIPNDQPTDVVQATLGEVRASPVQRAKIQSFVPDPSVLDKIIDANPKQGQELL